MKYFIGGTFFLMISLLFSCKKDFNINAEWKDIAVIYGLLNQNDTLHIIKVNKAFLGDDNAYKMAKISDSINYPNATVTLEQIKNGSTIHTITLEDTILSKDTGIFATDNNKVYKTRESLDPTSIYKLVVNIPGKAQITSSTSLINGFTVLQPVEYAGSVSFGSSSPYRVIFKTAPNARLYELTIRFYYYEILNGDTTLHHLDWVQNSTLSSNLTGNEQINMEISGNSFFQFVANKISPVQNIVRVAKQKSLDFMFLAGGDDLNTYIEVSSPSNTIVQEKPFFTNISNGIGIFSSKYNKTIKGKEFDKYSVDSLAKGKFTKNLGFKTFYESDSYWGALQ